jgi:hypothetical protein
MPLVVSRIAALLALLATFMVPTIALASANDACAMPQRQCASVSELADCCCHSLGGATAPATAPGAAGPQAAAGDPFEIAAQHAIVLAAPAPQQACAIPPAPPRAGLVNLFALFSTLLI